jgi:Ca2+-binding EF-hand superfamily protein
MCVRPSLFFFSMSLSLLSSSFSLPHFFIQKIHNKQDQPSINDYYKSLAKSEKPIKYQHGLGNYSNVTFGDERVSFKKSMSQVTFQPSAEVADKLKIRDEKKSKKQRMLDYEEANRIVGPMKIQEMEQMMRDKLQQRTKTGPFQLRKTFKYFDRDGSGGIDFSEFQRAMELMGFAFTDIQQLALFARYDESYSGEVDYSNFVQKVMESDFKGVSSVSKKALNALVTSTFLHQQAGGTSLEGDDDSDVDADELKSFRRVEVQKLFNVIDVDKSGIIEKDEMAHLLQSLGVTLSVEEIDIGFAKLDKDSDGAIDFNEFYQWYEDVATLNGV